MRGSINQARISTIRSVRSLREAVVRERSRTKVRSAPIGFIVSTGRTGTKFWESFFATHPNVVCLHEPSPDLFELGIAKYRKNAKAVQESLYRLRYRYIRDAIGRDAMYLESNPYLSLLIHEAAHEFPTARFLWVTRDPATYVPSAYSKSPDGSGSMYFYGDDDWRERLAATDLPDDRHREEWKTFDRFDRICWYWNACNQLIAEQLTTVDPGRVKRVGFESLFGGDLSEIGAVADFFGVDMASDAASLAETRINENPRQLLERIDGWSAAQQRSFDRLTQPMREQLGY